MTISLLSVAKFIFFFHQMRNQETQVQDRVPDNEIINVIVESNEVKIREIILNTILFFLGDEKDNSGGLCSVEAYDWSSSDPGRLYR